MIWSISESRTFRRCQRQWYFKDVLASPTSKDPIRHTAYLLGKLQSISTWRGSIVDTVISQTILPAVRSRRTIRLDQARGHAQQIFDRQLAFARRHSLHEPGLSPAKLGTDFAAFYEMEYSGSVDNDEVERACGKSGVLQPIMPLDSPVKVRPWELTVYPRSHIRR